MNVNRRKLISVIMFVTTMLEATHVHVGKDMSWEQMAQVAQVHFYNHAYCYFFKLLLADTI